MAAIAGVLERAGHTTFLPHRDGLEAYVLRLGDSALSSLLPGARALVDRAIFSLDVYELVERCEAVVCNLNGRVPDEGMVVEAAIAFAVGVPVVHYKADARAPFGGVDNAMLTSLSAGGAEARLERLPARVSSALSQARGRGAPSPSLARAIDDGRRIAALLARLPAEAGKQRFEAEVVARVVEALEDTPRA